MKYRVVWRDRSTGKTHRGVPVADRSLALDWLRESEREHLSWDIWIEEVQPSVW